MWLTKLNKKDNSLDIVIYANIVNNDATEADDKQTRNASDERIQRTKTTNASDDATIPYCKQKAFITMSKQRLNLL